MVAQKKSSLFDGQGTKPDEKSFDEIPPMGKGGPLNYESEYLYPGGCVFIWAYHINNPTTKVPFTTTKEALEGTIELLRKLGFNKWEYRPEDCLYYGK